MSSEFKEGAVAMKLKALEQLHVLRVSASFDDQTLNYVGAVLRRLPLPEVGETTTQSQPAEGGTMEGLTVGRIVHYVYSGEYHDFEGDPLEGTHVAAIIVAVKEAGRVHLSAFMPYPGTVFLPNIAYSETQEPGTWHWIERA